MASRDVIYPIGWQDPGVPGGGSFGIRRGKRRRERGGRPSSRPLGERFGEANKKAHESIGFRGTSCSGEVRSPVGNKALESRDISTFWSSEQQDEMSETAGGQGRRKAYRSAGGRSSGG